MSQRAAAVVALCAAMGLGPSMAQGKEPPTRAAKGKAMAQRATGTFDVKVQPLPADEKVPGLKVGRYGVDKQWKGDFEGTSKGEMMTADTSVEGSGGYAAVELMTGALKGRTGTFTVVHRGTMRKNADFDMVITVVPDSGTGQLTGIAGTVTILIEGGKHSYTIDYTLP